MKWLALTAFLFAGSAFADSNDDDDAISLSVAHKFSRTEARARVQMLLDYWHKRFGLKSSWTGDSVSLAGNIWGVSFTGVLEVDDLTVHAAASDPGFLWRGKARSYVTKKLKKYLSPTYEDP